MQVFHMLKPKHKNQLQNMQLLVASFQNNYEQILSYLPWQQHFNVKLICRGIYYLSITNDIWTGLRLEVMDKKMQLFDDIDFVQEQAKVISKQEKQIRIHSLKKNNNNIRIREASNVKEKKIALNTIHNQLPFRSTQVGFKRLLRNPGPNKTKINSVKEINNTMLDLVQIPRSMSSKDLIIDVKDPWAVNLQRAHALSGIARKWNEFHHKTVTQLKQVQKDMSSLVKKCIKVDRNTTEYLKLFEQQPYSTIRQLFDGAQKQLLIDDQLNKLGKIFVKNHKELIGFGTYLQIFISKTHQACNKLNRQNSSDPYNSIIQSFSVLEEIIEEWIKIARNCPSLVKYLAKSLLEINDSYISDLLNIELDIVQQPFPLYGVSLLHLSKRPDYFQVLFQSFQRICGGILKLCEGGEEQNMGINLSAGKFKNMKAIAHHLWNISKYFGKLTKQLQAKQKKGAVGGKGAIIRNFLQSYQNQKSSSSLLDWKYPTRAQKQVSQLKQRINNLKNVMQNE